MTGFGEAPGGLENESEGTEDVAGEGDDVAGGADDVSGRTDDQSGGTDETDGEAETDEDDESGGDDHDAVESVDGRPCPLCGAGMTHRHCEYVCPLHGVVYDCSDTFY